MPQLNEMNDIWMNNILSEPDWVGRRHQTNLASISYDFDDEWKIFSLNDGNEIHLKSFYLSLSWYNLDTLSRVSKWSFRSGILLITLAYIS